MAGESPITGEVSNSKVAAVFATEAAAREAAEGVRSALDLDATQVQVVTPMDPHPGRKLEPESGGIFRTILVAHAKLGLAGMVVGALAFWALHAMGLPMIVLNAPFALGVMIAFGAVAGLMLGGLVSLRPDHDAYILAVRDALAAGRCAVVVHAFSMEQRARAAEALRARGGETTSTL